MRHGPKNVKIQSCLNEIYSNIRTVKHVSDTFLAKNIFHLDNGVSCYNTKQLGCSIPSPEANIL